MRVVNGKIEILFNIIKLAYFIHGNRELKIDKMKMKNGKFLTFMWMCVWKLFDKIVNRELYSLIFLSYYSLHLLFSSLFFEFNNFSFYLSTLTQFFLMKTFDYNMENVSFIMIQLNYLDDIFSHFYRWLSVLWVI